MSIYIHTHIYTSSTTGSATGFTTDTSNGSEYQAATRSFARATSVTDEAMGHASSTVTLLCFLTVASSTFKSVMLKSHESRATTSTTSSSISLLSSSRLRIRQNKRLIKYLSGKIIPLIFF